MSTMSYSESTRRSESSMSRMSMDGDTTEDGDDRDETKRRSRNLSEKKRRDQFNVLINELSTMVSSASRKMDKSTVLKAAIAFLKAHNAELAVQSQVQETIEDWKPSFLSNEEFTHLMLEALDGFIIVISNHGKILYLSESITSLLGYLSSDLVSSRNTIYDFIRPEERNELYGVLTNHGEEKYKGQLSMDLNFKVGGLKVTEENQNYQLVQLSGYFKRWIASPNRGAKVCSSDKNCINIGEPTSLTGNSFVLIAIGRLVICDMLREMSVVVDSEKNEFGSRHSLEWKFLFLDHRAPPIIGYMPFEVLGTSGYDYYHFEDLEKVATCHETLMQRGEGTSCYYRFLTKGQQWIWLQTRCYITYHQWNSKPEFIVCTHRVVSYADVMKKLRGDAPFSSAFEEPRANSKVGPSVPKQFKVDNSAKGTSSSSSLKSSGRHKNGSLSYGSVGCGKRNSNLRKLELPPKFASTLTASHPLPVMMHSQNQPTPIQLPPTIAMPLETSIASSNGMNIICSKPLGTAVAIAIRPQLPHTSHHVTLNPCVNQTPIHSAAVTLPVAYNPPPKSHALSIPTGTIQATIPQAAIVIPPPELTGGLPVAPSPPYILQDQLMKKHAELQRQILQQQEELRRVSEQLMMGQCGWIQGDSLLLPQPTNLGHPIHSQHLEDNSAIQMQSLRCQSATPSTTYSPLSAPPSQAPSSSNPETGST